MKIRTGFVSNSSSSSFCVLGISMRTKELEHIIEELENGETTLNNAGLQVSYDDDGYEGCVGITVHKLEAYKDKTVAEVYEETRVLLEKVLGIKVKKVSWHEGTEYC